MSKKVFISYSHKDETFKESLDEHLSMLKRNHFIEDWHDRKIVAGQDWAKEISENLEKSELILFLISPSFLASDYCFNVEMKRAIKMHNEGKAQLIPIVIRPCDWAIEELSSLQAVPKDAKPIATWQNSDEAWLDAINGIKRRLSSFVTVSPTVSIEIENNGFQISDGTLDWIDDTEVLLTEPSGDKIKLSQIYISPDLEIEELLESKDTEKICSSDIVFTKPKRYLIYGEEQQGKTSLLKHAFSQFLKSETVSVYLEAKNIDQSDIKKSLVVALKSQYVEFELEQFLAMPNKALLIDDFDRIGLNSKYRAVFLASVNHVFTQVIIICHSSFNYVAPEIQELNGYERHELLGLGHIIDPAK